MKDVAKDEDDPKDEEEENADEEKEVPKRLRKRRTIMRWRKTPRSRRKRTTEVEDD